MALAGSILYLTALSFFVSLALSMVEKEAGSSTTESYHHHVLPDNHIPHWDEAPSSLADYPRRGNRTIINPWVYTDRLGLYKILLHATSTDPTLGRDKNTANILWGLPLQHGWQFSSGRLVSFPNRTSCNSNKPLSVGNSWNCISPSSWWASMNYYLSVAPFLGAVKAGLFCHWSHEIEISASLYRPGDYCTSLANCTARFPSMINSWVDFFKILKYRLDSPNPYFISKDWDDDHRFPPTPPSTLSPREQDIVSKLWVAHTESLETAQPIFNSLLPHLPEPEQRFGLSWAHHIDYIAAVNFVTDLNTTVAFQSKYLPMRVLRQGDKPPDIPDLSWDVNMVLYVLQMALDVDQKTGDALKGAWQALMCSPVSKARGRYMIANFSRPLVSLWNLVILLWYYITKCLMNP